MKGERYVEHHLENRGRGSQTASRNGPAVIEGPD